MDLTKKYWQWILLVCLAFIWGTSFILMKRGLDSFSAVQVASLRIFLSFLILIPFIIRSLKKINSRNLLPLILVGILGNGIPAYLFAFAQTNVNSSLAGMLNSLTPFFTLLTGIILFQTRVKILNVAGVLIGIIGASGLVIKDDSAFFEGSNWYALLIVVATLLYGFNINQVKKYLHDQDGITITALAFLFAGPVSGVILLFTDFHTAIASEQALTNFGFIFLLALLSSVIAVIGFYQLVRFAPALFVSSVTYIIPVFAIGWGTMDGEQIRLIDLLWIGLILLGVYFINAKSESHIK